MLVCTVNHCLEILNLALSLKYCPENINRVDVVND